MIWYPIWWLLGIPQLVALGAALLMAAELARLHHIRRPAGLGWWLVFLVWVFVGVVVLQVNAPGALPGASSTRYLTWGLRVSWYLEATVVILYVANVRKAFTTERIFRIFSWMFVTTVLGGLLGSIVPAVELHSVLDLVLPHGLTSNAFVSAQIHPTLAERQDYIGDIRYRPSAPFTYANQWGLNYACFLPFFVLSWCSRSAGWRRYVAPFVLLGSLIPVIYSLNRGLWAALLISLTFVAVKQALAGHIKMLGVIAAGVIAAVVVVAVSPLGATLQGRFSGHNSNEGRTNLGVRSLESVATKSPIIGFGTTRKVQGSFYSIAGGSSPACPNCSPPAFGTQGFIWFIIFGEGFVGAFLCVGFFVVQLLRYIRLRSPTAVACLVVLLNFLLTLPIYDWSISAAFAVMTAIGILWRESTPVENPWRSRWTIPDGEQFDAHAVRVLSACVVLALLVAGGFEAHRGPTFIADASVVLPDPQAAAAGIETLTLDTEARRFSSPPVLAAVARVMGHPVQPEGSPLTVTATANTRILNVSTAMHDAKQAHDVVAAAVSAFLQERARATSAERAEVQSGLAERTAQTSAALRVTSRSLAALHRPRVRKSAAVSIAQLEGLQSKLGADLIALNTDTNLVAHSANAHARIVEPATTHVDPGRWNIALGTGLALGILIGAVLVGPLRRIGGRVSSRHSDIAPLSPAITRRAVEYRRAAEYGRLCTATEFLSIAPDDAHCNAVANAITQAARELAPEDRAGRPSGVMLVARARSRLADLAATERTLDACGVRVVGLLVVESPRSWRKRHATSQTGSIL
jgi:hypothetical protein